jgi:hypothetical protein
VVVRKRTAKQTQKQMDNRTVLRVLKQQNRTEVEGEQNVCTGVTPHSTVTALRTEPCYQGDYTAYLDSMLAHLRRVHRGQVLRYYGLEDADG